MNGATLQDEHGPNWYRSNETGGMFKNPAAVRRACPACCGRGGCRKSIPGWPWADGRRL